MTTPTLRPALEVARDYLQFRIPLTIPLTGEQISSMAPELAALIEARDKAVLAEAITLLTQAGGIIVEFGNMNGFRNLSDAELGKSVHEMAKAIAAYLNKHAPLSPEQISVVERHRALSTDGGRLMKEPSQ